MNRLFCVSYMTDVPTVKFGLIILGDPPRLRCPPYRGQDVGDVDLVSDVEELYIPEAEDLSPSDFGKCRVKYLWFSREYKVL